jgi:hypothetical protein
MKHRIFAIILGAAALIAPAWPKPSPSPFPLPYAVEKELAARAANVTEVTLGKGMLDFAAKFMDKNDKDQAAVKQLIEGLDGIYVRDYEFDKEGQYSMDELQQLRQAFATPEWTPMVHERESKGGGESTDVMMKMVNGEPQGIFVLDAEPKELTIVLILGPIRMDQLASFKGLSGLSKLGDVDMGQKSKGTKGDKGDKGEKEKGRRPMNKYPNGNRHFWIPVGCAVLCVLLTAPWWVVRAAGEGGFDGVVDSIESPLSPARHAHSADGPGQRCGGCGHTWRRGRRACCRVRALLSARGRR